MANTNTPFGFSQYSGTGSAPTYEQVAVQIASNAAAIYYGDAVIAAADGTVTAAAAQSTQVTGAVAGIFVGCKYLSTSQKRTVWSNYWQGGVSNSDANGVIEGYIINDPNAKWKVQSDATGLTQAAVNANVGFNTGTGTTSNGISGSYLDVSTLNTTATLPFRVVSLLPANSALNGTDAGAYNIAIVAFNNAASKNLTGV